MFSFKPLKENDFLLLADWFKQPHVAQWWEAESKQTLLKKIQSDWLQAFIVELNNQPIGYIQCYYACKEDSGWPDQPAGTWGIDQFIGEPDCIGKGYGTQMIKEFVEMMFNGSRVKPRMTKNVFENTKITRIITDPKPNNARAIRCYEKVGFKKIELTQTPDGTVELMVLTKF